MKKINPYILWLMLLTAVWLLPAAFSGKLESGDETRVAGITAEMVLRNEWIVPRLNGQFFLEYPPLFYLWSGVLFRLFGMTDAAARLASVLAAAGSVFLLRKFVRRLGGTEPLAFGAAVILMTSGQFWMDAHRARVDSLLAFFVLLAFYGFLRHIRPGEGEKPYEGLVYCALGAAGGVLTKGLIGAVLPASGIGIYLIADDVLSRKFRWKRYMLLAAAFLTGFLPVLLWGFLLWKKAGDQALYTVTVVNNFGRFSGSQGDHASAWWDYLVKLPETFQPWLIFLFGGLGLLAYRAKKTDRRALLMLAFLLVPYAVLTAASAKRLVYLLPLAPMAAVTAAVFMSWLIARYPERFRCLTARPLRFWGILAVIAGLAVNTVWFFRCRYRAERDEVAVFWRETERTARQEKRRIVLYHPHERTRGAAVFYLRRIADTDSIPGFPELWIVRRDWPDGSRKYDRHRALRMPEEEVLLKGKP